ncbi:efflux RND transporter periplasmic adaptor subunit [Ochrovirga pacifica]|uniref:efflux RND transporter periplasmic adaptor subunit n=1 Tax=Ochrovirga pacifica TaxID=1042376 RepID=UPI00025597EA|nr:efflux RND transporter periplasmic adaptor subunit [Ochrovirga pacifica]
MKKTIQSIVGSLLILALSLFIFGVFSDSKKQPRKNKKNNLKTVQVNTVKNQTYPISIKSTGAVLAKDRIALYSEVAGVFLSTSKSFKPGVSYQKGQTLVQIDPAEFLASVQSQRTNFKSLIISILADIQFDYPEELQTWETYANNIQIENILAKLPTTDNKIFYNYLSAKDVFSTYYNIKNLEQRLKKYTLEAPFTGVLVQTEITPGTLVSAGQKLGEFIKPHVYELELNVNASFHDFLKIGKEVQLSTIDQAKTYQGKVSRINSQINRDTQTVQVFVEIQSQELKEGVYLQANVQAKEVEGLYEINRNLIVDQNKVYLLDNNKLVVQPIIIMHANPNTVLVKGLKNGSKIISSPIVGGYEGMKVLVKN